LDCYQNEIYA
jgi:MIZ/SP-RING zinc finger